MIFGKRCNCEGKVRDLEIKLGSMELQVAKLETHITSLRGLVNRKLQGEEQTEGKDLYLGLLKSR